MRTFLKNKQLADDATDVGHETGSLSLSDQAYDAIVNLILTYQLRLGERTSVAQLAERLKLGRTPVKEAIARLEAEGLLSVSGRSGTTVKEIDSESARQLFALRRHLEAFAVDEAVKYVTEEQLKELHALLTQLNWSTDAVPGHYVRSNVRFHAAIVACANNPTLNRLYGQIQLQTQIVVYLYHMTNSTKEKVIRTKYQEHVDIYDALVKRDAKRLRVLLDQHAATTERSVIDSLGALGHGSR